MKKAARAHRAAFSFLAFGRSAILRQRFEELPELPEFSGNRLCCELFHPPIALQHINTKIGELRTATTATAGGRANERSDERCIHRFDQQPCTTVRHAHLACRRRYGTAPANRLEQLCSTGTNRDAGTEQYPQAGSGCCLVSRFFRHTTRSRAIKPRNCAAHRVRRLRYCQSAGRRGPASPAGWPMQREASAGNWAGPAVRAIAAGYLRVAAPS